MSNRSNDEDDKGAGDDFREGFSHLFSAFRKVVKNAEPSLAKSLDDAERVFGKLGRGGEALSKEVAREVATFAGFVADKIKTAADYVEGEHKDTNTHEQTPNTHKPNTPSNKED